MTPLLFLGQAVLSVVLLVSSRAPGTIRERVVRASAWLGVVSGAWMFVARDGLQTWRGFELGPGEGAIIGVAIACTWGLVLGLDLGPDRWWAGGLAGVAAMGLVGMGAARWTVLVLLFLVCGSLAMSVAASRASRAGLLSLAAADAGLVTVLVADVISRDDWSVPESIDSPLLVGLLVSCALRAGLVVRVGPLGLLGRPAAVMAPLALAQGLVVVSRWVERPLPLVAAAVLLLAIGIAGWSLLRRVLDPSTAGAWPVALGSALLLASERATVPASLGAVLGITVVCLWPDAMERGRLSRSLVLSGLAPTIVFGAVGIAARESFILATSGGDTLEVAAWLGVSALLPVSFATGVAVGIYSARSEPVGGYHPEAVFMTWVLLAGSIGAGFALGPGEVYAALGGRPAAIALAAAIAFGAVAALRVGTSTGPVRGPTPSCRVGLGPPPPLGVWAPVLAVALLAGGATATAWITVRGLQQGFL